MKPLTHADLHRADEHDLVTINEAAQALSITTATIRTWVRDDRLPAVRIERRLHVLLPQASELEHSTRHAKRGRPRASH